MSLITDDRELQRSIQEIITTIIKKNMSKERIRVVARVNIRPDKLDDTLAAFDELVAATRDEAGCVTYEVLQNVEDAHEMTFVEEWASAEALQEHFATPHFTGLAGRVEELLTGPPDIRRYTLIK